MRNPGDVPPRIQADEGRHAGKKSVRGSIQAAHADGLPFQVADRAYPLGAEQLKAADVDPSEDHDRRPPVHLNDELWGEVARDVGLAGAERRVKALWPARDAMHIREALAPQQVFRYILGSLTEAQAVMHPDLRRLGGRGRR